jgi:hypothetical protein
MQAAHWGVMVMIENGHLIEIGQKLKAINGCWVTSTCIVGTALDYKSENSVPNSGYLS